ncbi:UDP-glucosyltransferase 2-like [Planococcus citri]|uniref:UDP-glucosyltransferase 2-like n=1 Tax=Planococcus citri TaxID=170843 RepID=UPI0031F84659
MNNNFVLVLFSLVILFSGCVRCGNIVGILPTQDEDHFAIGESVIKALLAKGHSITLISNYALTNVSSSKYRHIGLETCSIFLQGVQPDRYFKEESVERTLTSENSTCNCISNRAEYQSMELEEYDLMVVSMEYHSCFLRLSKPLNVPVIWIVPTNQNILANRLAGNMDQLHPILKGKLYVAYLHFKSRVISAWNYFTKYAYHWQIQRYVDSVNKEILPKVSHVKDDVDLIFYNTHFSVFPRTHVPNVVEIAGVHIEPPKTMCPRVGQFIDDSENGVIFISTPTQQPYRQMLEKKTQTFEISFLRVLQSVLWKRSTALAIPNYNLFWNERLPQREILNHTNVIVFISCASLNNIYEAVHSATPFIGIVCEPSQSEYMDRLEELGVGIKLSYANLNEVTLVNAINLIWQQKSYGEKMQKLSAAFNDRTMTPLNTAVYWAEYAIKHGASHLKSESSKIPLYTYLLLDIGPISMVLLAIYTYYGMKLYIKAFLWLKRKLWPRLVGLKNRIL